MTDPAFADEPTLAPRPPTGRRKPGVLKRPPLALTLAEPRALGELAATAVTWPVLRFAPRGDGHPVMVLPGFLASDLSSKPMRALLERLGHDARGWGHGRSWGRYYKMRDVLTADLEALVEDTGRKASLVGWSLGGLFARHMALARPDLVRRVVTIAAPFAGNVRATQVKPIYDAVSPEGPPRAADVEALAGALPVPSTSIYSKADGIVPWRAAVPKAVDPTETIEIRLASHSGLIFHPATLWAVADRLAQAEGMQTPFSPIGPFYAAYGPARRG